MAQTINVSMDATSVVTSAEAMTRAIGAMTASVKNASLESAKYGSAGELISGTMRGVDTEGRKFVATLGMIGGKLGVVSVKFQDLNKDIQKSKDHFAAIGQELNKVSSMFERSITFKGLNALNDQLKESVDSARKFQVEISLIRTISQDNQLSFGQWGKGLQDVSNKLGIGLADVTKAAYDTISNQVAKGGAVFDFLKQAGDLARVNMGATLTESVNLLSSAINAYNLSASSAQSLSALFFATIDEGRVTMKDMADTFGRVAILAKGLDIPIHELASSIAFLTQKGVTTDDAFTFMKNVFIQLQKPSEQLTAFFKSIGVESGKAAIATYGYMGILQKIKAEVGSGNLEVAKLFPEIRANIPIQAALNDLEGYERITKKFGNEANLIQEYQKAIDIRAESPADFINNEFNKLKNTFIVDIGQKLLTLIKDLLLGLGTVSKWFTGDSSMSAGLNLLIVSIRDVTIGIIAFRTAAAITTTMMLAYSAATATAGVVTQKTAAQVVAANIAIRATVIGLLASLAAIVIARQAFSNDLLSSGGPMFENLNDDFKKMQDEIRKTNAVKLVDPFAEMNERAKKGFQDTLQGLAKLSVEAQSSLGKLRETNKLLTKDFENGFKGYTDGLKNKVKKIGEAITEAENLIKRSKKGIQEFADSSNKLVDDVRLANLDPQGKQVFLDKQIKLLEARVAKLYDQGTPESVAEGDKLIEQIRAAKKAKFDAKQEQFKEQNPGLTDVQYKNKALQDSIGLEDEINGIYAQRVALVKELERVKKAEIARLKEEQALQKEAVRKVEDKFKAFNTFSTVEADGAIKKTYRKDGSGKIDIDKAVSDFDRDSKALLAALPAAKTVQEVNDRMKLEEQIKERRKGIIAELGAIQRAEDIKNASHAVQVSQANYKDKIDANKKELSELAALQKTSLETKLPETAQQFSGLNAGAMSYVKDPEAWMNKYGLVSEQGAKARAAYPKVKSNSDELAGSVAEFQAALRKAKDEVIQFGDTQLFKNENVLDVRAKSEAMLANTRKTYKSLPGGPTTDDQYDRMAIPGRQDGMTFGQMEALVRKQVFDLVNNQGLANQTKAERTVVQGEYDKSIAPELDKLKGLSPATFKELDVSTKQAAAGMSEASLALFNLKVASDNLRASFANQFSKDGTPQAAPKDTFNPGGDAKPQSGSEPIPRAFGGWIGRPSSSIGPDKHHVLAGDGEFMVNAESASMYPDTLNSINKARRVLVEAC